MWYPFNLTLSREADQKKVTLAESLVFSVIFAGTVGATVSLTIAANPVDANDACTTITKANKNVIQYFILTPPIQSTL
jgi:hypothetical protein